MNEQQVPKEVALGEFMQSSRFKEYFPEDSRGFSGPLIELFLGYCRASFRAGWEACEKENSK